jgi:hypothetical protein
MGDRLIKMGDKPQDEQNYGSNHEKRRIGNVLEVDLVFGWAKRVSF